MKFRKQKGTFRPFKELKKLIEKKSLNPLVFPDDDACKGSTNLRGKQTPTSQFDDNMDNSSASIDERDLFLKAMADVKPMCRGNRVERNFIACTSIDDEDDSKKEGLHHLNNLIETGEGFVVKNTPEYIEGTGYNVHPKVTTRLHRGDFSIQAHVDLHGLGVEDARIVFEHFLKESVVTGKRAVLVVHGRGLSSPDKPVLKIKVVEWLTRGPWRKWVIAFSSARSCDGGAGATYVLLRHRPLTRRHRKSSGTGKK